MAPAPESTPRRHRATPTEAELRDRAARAVARVGVDGVVHRTGVDAAALRAFLDGGPPTPYVAKAARHFDLRPYADLRSFLVCYFHEDYAFESVGDQYRRQDLADWQRVVDAWMDVETTATLVVIATDIADLLATVRDDEVLASTLEEFGCCFSFTSVPISPHDWLAALRGRLLREIAHRGEQ